MSRFATARFGILGVLSVGLVLGNLTACSKTRPSQPVEVSQTGDEKRVAGNAGQREDDNDSAQPKQESAVSPDNVPHNRDVSYDWPMFGRDQTRNAVSPEKRPPVDWDIGEFDRKTGQWIKDKARNIKWIARLGSTS